MIIGARVQQRIDELGTSQAAVGRDIGMDQSTISGIVRGEQRKTGKLHLLARRLETTPAYLTGETNDPDANAPNAPELSWQERQLIDCFGSLDEADRVALLRIAHTMAGKSPTAPTLHSPGQAYRSKGA